MNNTNDILDTQHSSNSRTVNDESVCSFDDIQPFFDDQSRVISKLLITLGNDSSPKSKHIQHPRRYKFLRSWLISSIISVSFAVFWGATLSNYVYDTAFLILSLCIEAAFVYISIKSIAMVIYIIRHNPATSSLDRMLDCLDVTGSRLSVLTNPYSDSDSMLRTILLSIAASFAFLIVFNAPYTGTVHDTESKWQLMYIIDNLNT